MSDGAIFDGDIGMVGEYLRALANQVGLRDWTIQVGSDVPDNQSFQADAEIIYGQKWVTIRFAADWPSLTEEAFRRTCVHELIHAHLNAISQPLEDAELMLGKMAFTPIYSAHTVALEICCDSIASEWARHLPLPSDWLDDATRPEGA